jgi:hypothetical protein
MCAVAYMYVCGRVYLCMLSCIIVYAVASMFVCCCVYVCVLSRCAVVYVYIYMYILICMFRHVMYVLLGMFRWVCFVSSAKFLFSDWYVSFGIFHCVMGVLSSWVCICHKARLNKWLAKQGSLVPTLDPLVNMLFQSVSLSYRVHLMGVSGSSGDIPIQVVTGSYVDIRQNKVNSRWICGYI